MDDIAHHPNVRVIGALFQCDVLFELLFNRLSVNMETSFEHFRHINGLLITDPVYTHRQFLQPARFL